MNDNRPGLRFGARLDSVKGWFFDSAKVLAVVDARTRRFLSHAGGLVRKIAKNSIRKRNKPSTPGTPPSSHTGILKRFIFYRFDPMARSVVIGPTRTNQVFYDRDGQPVTGTVPQVLEEGGQITVLEWFLGHKVGWVRADQRSRRRLAARQTRYRNVNVKARPYMAPALKKVVPQLPGLWARSINRAAA